MSRAVRISVRDIPATTGIWERLEKHEATVHLFDGEELLSAELLYESGGIMSGGKGGTYFIRAWVKQTMTSDEPV
jgi:hypothetical protein